jgi:hypothetical protein
MQKSDSKNMNIDLEAILRKMLRDRGWPADQEIDRKPLIMSFAKEIARQALVIASENAKTQTDTNGASLSMIDKQSILDVEKIIG